MSYAAMKTLHISNWKKSKWKAINYMIPAVYTGKGKTMKTMISDNDHWLSEFGQEWKGKHMAFLEQWKIF